MGGYAACYSTGRVYMGSAMAARGLLAAIPLATHHPTSQPSLTASMLCPGALPAAGLQGAHQRGGVRAGADAGGGGHAGQGGRGGAAEANVECGQWILGAHPCCLSVTWDVGRRGV